MGFFDLNIPYYESDKHVAARTTRLKLVVKAVELGYTGVAYNRTIDGVMSDSHRCATPLFPVSSVIKLAPTLSTAVKLHREFLNVPVSSPFRQYTRLTVAVEKSFEVSALNSGNPILKTYDIVAVRPMSQNAFEQACQASEVDLIALDFSEKLPFRLKQPMVKKAIERGVYFEISYSGLITDAQARKLMISNAKLLVDWTRGKNLIFSSAAPSVAELRGPNDVANLSFLLGLSTELAKSALSKNCRSLIGKALRKKHYYKEAIRVEVISSAEQCDSKEASFSDWLKWDPISSGEGDLLLDDMARSFSASTEVSKSVKAINFASIMDNLPPRGLQIWDMKSAVESAIHPVDIGNNLIATKETEVSIAVTEISPQPKNLVDLLKTDQTEHQSYSCEDSIKSFSPADTLRDFGIAKEVINHTTNSEEDPKNSTLSDVHVTPPVTEMHNLQPESCITEYDAHGMLPGQNATFHSSTGDPQITVACNVVADAEKFPPSEDSYFFAFESEEAKRSSSSGASSGAQDHAMEEFLIETNAKIDDDLSSTSDMSLHEDFTGKKILTETRDGSTFVSDVLPDVEFVDKLKDNKDHPVADCESSDEVTVEDKKEFKDHAEISYPALADSSGRGKVKQRITNRGFLFPLKRLLNPTPFKRKAQKRKTKTKLR